MEYVLDKKGNTWSYDENDDVTQVQVEDGNLWFFDRHEKVVAIWPKGSWHDFYAEPDND
jgi:uncharacterized protein YneR